MTGEHPSYQGVDNDTGDSGLHQTMNHSAKKYVRGAVRRKALKALAVCSSEASSARSIRGQRSHKHLDRYLNEFESSYNNRKNPGRFRDTLLQLVTSEHIE